MTTPVWRGDVPRPKLRGQLRLQLRYAVLPRSAPLEDPGLSVLCPGRQLAARSGRHVLERPEQAPGQCGQRRNGHLARQDPVRSLARGRVRRYVWRVYANTGTGFAATPEVVLSPLPLESDRATSALGAGPLAASSSWHGFIDIDGDGERRRGLPGTVLERRLGHRERRATAELPGVPG